MLPYRQGSLDELCGLYALINASRLADPSLNESECQEVFKMAFRWLYDNYEKESFLQMLCDGLFCDKLRRLHKNIFRKQWPKISLHQPFLRNMPKNANDFWARLEENTPPAVTGTGMVIAIVGGGIDHVGGYIDHWSVVRTIDAEKIVLFDSCYEGLHPLRRDCGYEEGAAPYFIPPGCVLVLKHTK